MSITNLLSQLHIRDIQIYVANANGLRDIIELTLTAFYKGEGTLKCSLGRLMQYFKWGVKHLPRDPFTKLEALDEHN